MPIAPTPLPLETAAEARDLLRATVERIGSAIDDLVVAVDAVDDDYLEAAVEELRRQDRVLCRHYSRALVSARRGRDEAAPALIDLLRHSVEPRRK